MTTRHRTIIALTGAAVCFALAGCTNTSEGQPRPQTSAISETTPMESSTSSAPPSTSSSSGELPTDGAPKVKNPLNTSRYQQNPCQMLTAAQLQQLNLPAQGEPGQGPLGLACTWLNRDTFARVGLQWGDKNPRGLSGAYAARKAGRWAYFIEYPDIEGFPAVASDLSDRRDVGTCIVEVGVSDQLTFQVSVQLSRANVGKNDPCKDGAVLVAGMMLQTMKAGN